MPGTRCAVKSCPNTYHKTKVPHSGIKGVQIKYHAFPKNPNYSKLWIQRCNEEKPINEKYARICSDHFLDEDYERDLKGELLGQKLVKVLKKDAVPSIWLHINENQNTSSEKKVPFIKTEVTLQEIAANSSTCNVLKISSSLVSSTSSITNSQQDLNSDSVVKKDISSCIPESLGFAPTTNIHMLEDFERIVKEKKELEKNYSHLKLAFLQTRKKLQDCEMKLSMESITQSALRREVKRLKKAKFSTRKIGSLTGNLNKNNLQFPMHSPLSSNQYQILFGKKTKARWTAEELSQAFALRHCSKKAYVYVRNQMKFPLPGVSTLQKYASKKDPTQGTLTDVETDHL